jgi:hypothetical protein
MEVDEDTGTMRSREAVDEGRQQRTTKIEDNSDAQ